MLGLCLLIFNPVYGLYPQLDYKPFQDRNHAYCIFVFMVPQERYHNSNSVDVSSEQWHNEGMQQVIANFVTILQYRYSAIKMGTHGAII